MTESMTWTTATHAGISARRMRLLVLRGPTTLCSRSLPIVSVRRSLSQLRTSMSAWHGAMGPGPAEHTAPRDVAMPGTMCEPASRAMRSLPGSRSLVMFARLNAASVGARTVSAAKGSNRMALDLRRPRRSTLLLTKRPRSYMISMTDMHGAVAGALGSRASGLPPARSGKVGSVIFSCTSGIVAQLSMFLLLANMMLRAGTPKTTWMLRRRRPRPSMAFSRLQQFTTPKYYFNMTYVGSSSSPDPAVPP